MELGRTAKTFKNEKRVIRRWRFYEDEVKLRYQNVEVHGCSENVKSELEGGMKGYDLVINGVVVNRVAKNEVGEKILFGLDGGITKKLV